MRAERLHREVRRAFEDFVVPEFRAARSTDRGIRTETLTRSTPAASLTGMGIYDQIKQAIQDLIAPELHALRAQIDQVDSRLTTKIDSLRTELTSMKAELIAEIRRLDARIDGMDRELRTAIDIRERLAALEARRSS